MSPLNRRIFLGAAGAALISPAAALDADPKIVCVLMGLANDPETQARSKAFESGLEKEGWALGRNLRLEYRFAYGDSAKMENYAREFVAMKADCILGHSTPVLAALLNVTREVPIVFVSVSDPVGSGFVKSMARPGGNATGFTLLQATIPGKYVSILREMMPHLDHVTLMFNPDSVPSAGAYFMESFNEASREYKVEATVSPVNNPEDIEAAITGLSAKSGGALITVPDNFLTFHRNLIISLCAKLRVPAIYPYRYFAEAGGLLSYGVDAANLFYRSTEYVSRILRGTKPADLPVQGPTKFEMVINMKTAQALGVAVPRFLLAGADTVLE